MSSWGTGQEIFNKDVAEKLLDFQDTFSGCIDFLIETLEELRDVVCGIDVPNIELFPEPEKLPDKEAYFPEKELPF